jgi:hypothetical protein
MRHSNRRQRVCRITRHALPNGQPDAPIRAFNLASVSAARRLPCMLGGL